MAGFRSVDHKLLCILVLSIGTFVLYKRTLTLASHELGFAFVCLIAAGLALFIFPLRTLDLTPAGRVIYFALYLAMALYLVAGIPYPFAEPYGQDWMIAVLLTLAITAVFFPAAGLLILSLVYVVKREGAQALNLSITSIDYQTVIEFGVMVILASAIIRFWSNTTGFLAIPKGEVRAYNDRMLLILIGVHFGNYFWSGYEKLALDGGVFSWVLENPTWALSDFAALSGHHPLLGWPTALSSVSQFLYSFNTPLNFFVLFTQIVCLAVLYRKSWTIGLTAIYDLQHIGIFLTTGIFFWKWIILNTAIVAALKLVRGAFTPTAISAAIVMVIIGPVFFSIARLGWYDTRSGNLVSVTAETNDGEIGLPSNYFQFASVWAAQMDGMRSLSNRFPTNTSGTTSSYDIMRRANRCGLGSPYEDTSDEAKEALIRLVRKLHAIKVELGHFRDFDLYPHHIWSAPFYFNDAKNVEPASVNAYVWTLRRVCLGRDANGPKLERNEIADTLRISVSESR